MALDILTPTHWKCLTPSEKCFYFFAADHATSFSATLNFFVRPHIPQWQTLIESAAALARRYRKRVNVTRRGRCWEVGMENVSLLEAAKPVL